MCIYVTIAISIIISLFKPHIYYTVKDIFNRKSYFGTRIGFRISMDIENNINPKTGLPYKTTPEQRLKAREIRKKIFTDPILHEKHKLYKYNKWRNNPNEKKRIREYMRRYNMSPSRICDILASNAKKRNIEILFSKNDFIIWWNNTPNECFYCKRNLESANEFFSKKTGRLTVDRIDNKRGYEISNIVKACWLCNRIKADIFTQDEMLEIGKVIGTLTRFNKKE
jgi:hypothetical protein